MKFPFFLVAGGIAAVGSAVILLGDRKSPTAGVPLLGRYKPGSPEQILLFEAAARAAGLPVSWARSPGVIGILGRESGGRVGEVNYTYGDRAKDPSRWPEVWAELRAGHITARSSATGLGQLILDNVRKYYPHGAAGIGNPLEEAVGMLRYIQDRYGSPERAWALYGKLFAGY